jgi:methylenetetrahydrofolate reductase (NADPH)
MRKVIDILKTKKTFSFELFPPKTEQGYQNLMVTIEKLVALNPDFISCTYGAGGGSRDKTLEIVEHIQKKHQTIGVAHLTCVLHTKEEIKNILGDMKNRGISNILALRGDPPADNPNWQPGSDNFKYSSELCAFTKQNFDGQFGIGVAGFPEGHVLCPDRDRDAQYLKIKIDSGADFVITQLFFDNKDYFSYVERLKKLGVQAPVIPGILSITDYVGLVNFCKRCGASIPDEVKRIFEPIQHDKEKTLQTGIDFAIKQCKELLKGGAPGIHFYSLNKTHPADVILAAIRS